MFVIIINILQITGNNKYNKINLSNQNKITTNNIKHLIIPINYNNFKIKNLNLSTKINLKKLKIIKNKSNPFAKYVS